MISTYNKKKNAIPVNNNFVDTVDCRLTERQSSETPIIQTPLK